MFHDKGINKSYTNKQKLNSFSRKITQQTALTSGDNAENRKQNQDKNTKSIKTFTSFRKHTATNPPPRTTQSTTIDRTRPNSTKIDYTHIHTNYLCQQANALIDILTKKYTPNTPNERNKDKTISPQNRAGSLIEKHVVSQKKVVSNKSTQLYIDYCMSHAFTSQKQRNGSHE